MTGDKPMAITELCAKLRTDEENLGDPAAWLFEIDRGHDQGPFPELAFYEDAFTGNVASKVPLYSPDNIAALLDRIAELEAGLRPFADRINAYEAAAKEFGADHSVEVADDQGIPRGALTFGDLRRARARLEGKAR